MQGIKISVGFAAFSAILSAIIVIGINVNPDAAGNEATGVYKGFKRPYHVFTDAYPNVTDWPRRLSVASYEINYNINEVLKADPNASSPTYLKEPVWWDKP